MPRHARSAAAPDGDREPWLYVTVVAAAAVLALGAAVVLGETPREPTWVLWLALMSLLVSWGRPQVVGLMQLFNAGTFILAAIVLTGPVSAVVVATCPILRARNEPIKRLYNTAMRTLFALAGWVAYRASGGELIGRDVLDGLDLLALAGRLALTAAVVGLVNGLLLAGVVRASGRGSLRRTFGAMSRTVGASYAAYAVAAYLLVVLWGPGQLGELAALLCVPCFLVAQWALHQHVAAYETRQRALVALLDALDVRLPGARRQGEQVAEVSRQVAVALGMTPAEVTTLETAARLRDIGLLAAPLPDLGRDGPADPDIVTRHPSAARDVLGGIASLGEALRLVAAHHERVDGRGYPAGLPAHHIPLGARVIAVADAYVNLVDPVSDRVPLDGDEAVEVCRSRPDHLDPDVVTALATLVGRGVPLVLPRDGAITPDAARGSVADHAYPATTPAALP